MAKSEIVRVFAADGYGLTATRFSATGTIKGSVIVAAATGVPQGFYRRFAEYCSLKGYTTLTLDYRGIGLSKPDTLKGFHMNYLDWAKLDLAAAVDHMQREAQPLFMVGHSFGGHAFGFLSNHEKVSGFYGFGVGAAWHGWMPWLEGKRVQFLWNFVLPPLAKWKGYSPWKMFGAGEDLPLGAYEQWRHWCQFPHFFFDDPEMASAASLFAQIRTPMVAANALDDLWALPRSRDAFMRAYCNAPLEYLDLDPKRTVGPIGHMGYFRPHAQPLWDNALQWFDQRRAREFGI